MNNNTLPLTLWLQLTILLMTKQTVFNEIWFFTIPWKLEVASSIFSILILNAIPVSSVKSDTLQKKTKHNKHEWDTVRAVSEKTTEFILNVDINYYVLVPNQTHFSIAKVKITYETRPKHISIITLEGIEKTKTETKDSKRI